MSEANNLHLPNLSIKGFRGIDSLSIMRLGRVTLLTGMNSIGKTTVLDAIRVYAARGDLCALQELLWSREEVLTDTDEDNRKLLLPDYRALFHNRYDSEDILHNRYDSEDVRISIGTWSAEPHIPKPRPSTNLQITLGADETKDSYTHRLNDRYIRRFNDEYFKEFNDAYIQGLNFEFRHNQEKVKSWEISFDMTSTSTYYKTAGTQHGHRRRLPNKIRCEFLKPKLLDNTDLVHLWNRVVMTDKATRAISALQLLFKPAVENVVVVADNNISRPKQATRRQASQRMIIQFAGQSNAVPLGSLGGGAKRLFSVALALVNSHNGFLLIDEAENGIHYSLQRKYWDMVFRTAHKNNVQVLATTHSSDCIKGFAQAATDINDTEGRLIRLSRQYGYLQAVEYPEEEAKIAAEHGIETR